MEVIAYAEWKPSLCDLGLACFSLGVDAAHLHTEGREAIIMKNKPQHIWLTFLLMTPEGKLLQSIPWTERDYGSNTAQKQRKRTVSEVN